MLRGSFFDQNFTTDRDEVMEVFLAMDQDGNGMLTRSLEGSIPSKIYDFIEFPSF